MADQTEATQRPERRFIVKVMQTQEICVEQFDSINGELLTGDKKSVTKTVQNFIDDEKDMAEADYRLVVEEVEVPESPTPGEDEEAV